MKRRIVSVLMALVMALSLLPVQALAEDAAVGEPVTEIEQAEQTGEGEEPGDPEEQTGEGEEPGDPEEEQEPGEPEEPVREFVQGEAQLTVSTAAMAAGTAAETTEPNDIYEALSVGGSLKLLNDVDYGGSMSVGVNLTIDLNGYVLKMNGIKVENGAHLTIIDSRPDAEHKFTPNADGLWVRDEQNGTKTVRGGVIYGGTGSIGTSVYGGGVYVEGGGRFTMKGGNIVGCTASATFQARGGGVFVAEKGTFTMSGGSIAGCTTVGGYSYGGGIYNEGTVNLSGTAEIRDCHAKDSDEGDAAYGGGISDSGRASQISGNVRITGCTAGGGKTDAMSMYTGSVVSGGTFDGSVQNTGTISGGTFNGRVVNSNMITDGIFNGEVVNDYGTISGGTFNGVVTNYSTISEGAISGITVTYKANGGVYATQIVPSGSAAIKPVDPTNSAGTAFLGWFKADGTAYDFTQTVTEDFTLTAKFAAFTKTVTNWSELQDALANDDVDVVQLATNGIYPWGNVVETLYVERAVTLDLNGYVLKGDGRSVFEIKNGGHLTVIDSNPTAEHKFWVNNSYSYGVWLWNNESGDKTAYGGIINGGYTSDGGGVKVLEGGKLTMNGGSIVGCGATGDGGGVYVYGGGVFEMNTGAAIIGCASQGGISYGGGVYVNGTFTMNGGTIRDCVARGQGGGGVASEGQFTMNGGTIESCTAGSAGGAVYHASRAALTLNGTITSDNRSIAQPVFVQSGAMFDVIIGADADIQTNVYLSNCAVHANGGTVRGNLYANWDIKVSVDEGVTSGTIFYGKLTGNCDYNIDGAAVSYKVNGEDYATQFLRSGSTATQPTAPVVPAGRTFDGWLKANGTRWDFNTAVTENTTLMGWLYVPVTNETELRANLVDDTVDVIRLVSDITVDAILDVRYGRDVILDLNGYVLDLGGNKIYVNDANLASKLTIIDSRPDVEHKFTPSAAGLWARDEANGTKTVKGGVITGGHSDASDYCGGIDIGRNGTVIMEAGHIVGGYADSYGGGVHLASGGIFTMNGGSITGCRAKSMGGGVHMSSGTFTMNGGSITDCTASHSGGVYVGGGTFALNNGTIQGCTAAGDGGGVYMEDGTFTMTGGSITDCAAMFGGGVHTDGGTFTMTGGVIQNCTARTHGSALYLRGTMNAGGGTVDGTVVVNIAYDSSGSGKIPGIIQSAAGSTGATLFKQNVTSFGEIRHGTFDGTVTVDYIDSPSTIGGGTFNGLIKNDHAEVTFNGAYSPLGIVGKEPKSQNYTYYKVTFVLTGGTMDYPERYFLEDVHISDKIEPARAGYLFEGWYKDDGTAWDHANDKVTGNMTLTARWTACNHSGHTGAQPTCTTSVICTVCKGTIAALGHDWSPWTSNSDNTHTHSCLRVGCGYTETLSCADGNNNHICDDCGKIISNHEDGDNDHVCDICRKTISNHVDGDNDHVCDICRKTISNHVDTDKNHICDDCGKVISNHVDVDNNHICDDCRKVISDHKDTDRNHICDICGKTISSHADGNHDHICDICSKAISNHVDADKNHVCDICKRIISNHADGNHDHICDICSKAISNHTGGTAYCNAAKVCDYCGKSYGDKDPAHHANLVNVPAKAATTSAEGNIEYWHCGGCGKYYKDAAAQEEIKQEDTVIAKRRVYYAPSLYPVRNGTNPPSGTEYSGGVYGLIFRAAVSGITGVQVDGRTVGRGSYTVEGSYPVELYLKASYLNRLAKGSHTLTVLTDSGSLTAAFTVGSGKSSPTTFDAGIAVYTAAAVTSLTGLELLRRRRKEEE